MSATFLTHFDSVVDPRIERCKNTGCNVIAVDGKTERRSFSTKDRKSALHTVSAWSC